MEMAENSLLAVFSLSKEAVIKASESSVRIDGRQGFACCLSGHVTMIDMTGVTTAAPRKQGV